jgi:DNA polymerase III sliding clamp (beta) subunit (PCNA family)
MKAIFDLKEFKRVVTALKPFTQIDQQLMQYIMIRVNATECEAKCEALDGHRIAVEFIKCEADVNFVLYIKPFNFIKTDAERIEINLHSGTAYIDMGSYIFKIPQPEGIWYPTEKLISDVESEETVLKVGVNADLLTDALKNVKTDSTGRKSVIIECRNKKTPIIIRETKDRRNIRLVLPMNISD